MDRTIWILAGLALLIIGGTRIYRARVGGTNARNSAFNIGSRNRQTIRTNDSVTTGATDWVGFLGAVGGLISLAIGLFQG